MKKRTFQYSEKYAIWVHHDKRCWLCREPLRLLETSVDHVVPESLLDDEEKLREIIEFYSLPQGFNVNGFENWLPCHRHCNEAKGTTFDLTPANRLVLNRLIKMAPMVERAVESIKNNVKKDKLLAQIAVALEEETISMSELRTIVGDLADGSFVQFSTLEPDLIRLDNGYWVNAEDVAAEGPCECGQESCVGSDKTVYCYWPSWLSDWVIRKRLYWKCYDELIACPRCQAVHARGHVGKPGVCKSLLDQFLGQQSRSKA
jgi:5-methylcytosine-specific restriction endonuclease McrA